ECVVDHRARSLAGDTFMPTRACDRPVEADFRCVQGPLSEWTEERRKTAESNELVGRGLDNRALAERWLVQLGELGVTEDGPLQPAAAILHGALGLLIQQLMDRRDIDLHQLH